MPDDEPGLDLKIFHTLNTPMKQDPLALRERMPASA